MLRKTLVALVGLAIVVGFADYFGSADHRVRTTFQIPADQTVNEETIRARVLERFPLETREEEIYRGLERLGIGKDKLSSLYPADAKGKIVIRFELNPNGIRFVQRHYGIILELDEDRTLKNVVVHKWLTGL
jgi:hypothetical protein